MGELMTKPMSLKSDTMVATPLRGQTLQPAGAMLSVAEWEDDGQFTSWISPLHVHHQDEEIWYVLEGTLSFLLDGEEVAAPTGSCIIVPRGVAHAYRNLGPEPARYLIVMPDRVRRLVDAIHTVPRDEDAIRVLFAKYESEYIGWPEGD